jgi:hypothetical protein
MSVLDRLKDLFTGRRKESVPQEVQDLSAPGPERAAETLERDRDERAASPRPPLDTDDAYKAPD